MRKLAPWTIAVIALMALVLIFPSATPVSAATIVVNPGGGGNYTTIQAAINNASPGDTIAIKTGTYTENLNLSLMGSAIGGSTGNLQLVAVDGPGTVNLNGAGTKITNSGAFNGSLIVNGLNVATTNEDGIRLNAFANLVIVNSTFDPIGNDNTGHNAIELVIGSGTPNVVLYQNTFRNIANDAVQVTAQGSSQPTFTIVSNTITDNGLNANTTDQAISIEMRGTVNGRATIVGNTLTQLESRAVAVAANEAAQVRAQIVGNTIDTITTVDQAIVAETLNGSTTALLDVAISNNIIRNISSGNGIQVNMGGVTTTPSTPSITARIVGNTLTNIGSNDFDRGIVVIPGISNNVNLNGTINVLIADNQLSNIAASGLYIFADNSIDIDAMVRNNTITNGVTYPNANEAGFLFRTNNAAARLRLALTNNTATTATPGTNREIRVLHQTGTFQLEGNAALTVEQNIAADNPTAADSILVGGTIGIIARGTVATPGDVNPPVATDDTATAVSGIATTINVLANDLDPNENPVGLQYVTFTSFRGGTVTINTNGTPGNLTDDRAVYTSPVGYVGTDTFYYTA
ncbi:MAG: hypothetical protein JOZ51_24975, partial [Chloroflexi bacterium]|nr:hypothetical protein [Chloroflexota bacterium]